MPRFRFLLDDLGLESDETLRQRAMSALGRLSLWCLRNARTPETIVEGMGRWMALVREVRRAPNGMAALVTIWRYVLLVGDRFGPEDLVARLLATKKRAYVTRLIRPNAIACGCRLKVTPGRASVCP